MFGRCSETTNPFSKPFIGDPQEGDQTNEPEFQRGRTTSGRRRLANHSKVARILLARRRRPVRNTRWIFRASVRRTGDSGQMRKNDSKNRSKQLPGAMFELCSCSVSQIWAKLGRQWLKIDQTWSKAAADAQTLLAQGRHVQVILQSFRRACPEAGLGKSTFQVLFEQVSTASAAHPLSDSRNCWKCPTCGPSQPDWAPGGVDRGDFDQSRALGRPTLTMESTQCEIGSVILRPNLASDRPTLGWARPMSDWAHIRAGSNQAWTGLEAIRARGPTRLPP